MSDAHFYTSRDVLNDRYLRKIESLAYVSKDSILPWRKVVAWLSDQKDKLNKGNSVRTQGIYLQEWALGGYGEFKDDSFIVNALGYALLKAELTRLSRYLKPIDWDRYRAEVGPPGD